MKYREAKLKSGLTGSRAGRARIERERQTEHASMEEASTGSPILLCSPAPETASDLIPVITDELRLLLNLREI